MTKRKKSVKADVPVVGKYYLTKCGAVALIRDWRVSSGGIVKLFRPKTVDYRLGVVIKRVEDRFTTRLEEGTWTYKGDLSFYGDPTTGEVMGLTMTECDKYGVPIEPQQPAYKVTMELLVELALDSLRCAGEDGADLPHIGKLQLMADQKAIINRICAVLDADVSTKAVDKVMTCVARKLDEQKRFSGRRSSEQECSF